MASQRNSTKPLRPDKIGPVPCKLFQIIEKGGNFPSSLSETHSIETETKQTMPRKKTTD